MREYGIGACGTARMNAIPKELRVDKALAGKELSWNDLFGTVEDGVLCGLWQDSAQVLIMSTIHDLKTGTTRLRRRPKENRLNAKITRSPFGNEVSSTLGPHDVYGTINIATHINGYIGPNASNNSRSY